MTPEQEALFVANLPLVHNIACRWERTAKRYGYDYVDVVQLGAIGLLKATKAYEASRGTKFGTYAYHKIQGAIRNELARYQREKRSGRLVVSLEASFSAGLDVDLTPADIVGVMPVYPSDLGVDVYDLVSKLGVMDRRIVHMAADGYTYAEIAKVIGRTKQNVQQRIVRLRERFERLLTARERG